MSEKMTKKVQNFEQNFTLLFLPSQYLCKLAFWGLFEPPQHRKLVATIHFAFFDFDHVFCALPKGTFWVVSIFGYLEVILNYFKILKINGVFKK